ncbi:MAG: LamG-like jellyroll fold domain-containing protein [Myxococcota bacterium]
MNLHPSRPSMRVLLAPLLVAGLACGPSTYEIAVSGSSGGPPTAGTEPSAMSTGPTSTTRGDTDPSDTTETTVAADSGSSGGDCVSQDDGGWWRTEWTRRRLLEIDTTVFDAAVTDLPVLLRLDSEGLGPSWSERSGADLRFRAEGDVEVSYEIDDVDSDGNLAVWLSISELDPAAGSMPVWMYYGNPQAEAPDGAEAVWSGHISVHHLGTDLEDSAEDHTGRSNWEPEVCDGKCGPRIGVARRFDPEQLHEVIFDGHQDYDLGVSPYEPAVMEFTISLWMRAASLAEYPWGGLVAKGDDTWRLQASSFPDAPKLDERITFGYDCNPIQTACTGAPIDMAGNANLVSNVAVDDNQWHHVATTVEIIDEPVPLPIEYIPDVRIRIYIDGIEAATPQEVFGFLLPEDDQPVRLGHNISAANRWQGDLDEVRFEARARSAAEIAADYATVVNEHVAIGEEDVLCR